MVIPLSRAFPHPALAEQSLGRRAHIAKLHITNITHPKPPIATSTPPRHISQWQAAAPIPTRDTRPRTSPLPPPAIALHTAPPSAIPQRPIPIGEHKQADKRHTDGTLAHGVTPMRAAADPAKASRATCSARTDSDPWPPSSARASGTSCAGRETRCSTPSHRSWSRMVLCSGLSRSEYIFGWVRRWNDGLTMGRNEFYNSKTGRALFGDEE